MSLTAGCGSLDHYATSHRSEYLYSQDLGALKQPSDFSITYSEPYIIPQPYTPRPKNLPDLYPPVS